MQFVTQILVLAVIICFPRLSMADKEVDGADDHLVSISPGPRAQFDLQSALINAVPGDVIQLTEGTYRFSSELNVVCDNLTIRGAGPDKTILSFRGQHVGSSGLTSTGNAFVIEDLAVEDTVGNAIKTLGANGVIFRRVRVEWTDGPKSTNGAYGIYPVECRNVLIEDCVSIGASDAGIYVGQSQDVIVRGCKAHKNVAGIEIENTLRADVYENEASDNTGGILVFDLPGLNLKNGGQVRLFRNRIVNNNHPNFAPKGTMVADVPAGSGVMLMATDHVEIFDNEIIGNQTANIVIVSFLATQRALNDPEYDPYPEAFSIHDNRISNGGASPGGMLGTLLKPVVGVPFPDIFYDGIQNPARIRNRTLPAEWQSSIRNNGNATFANVHLDLFSPENVLKGRYRIDRDPGSMSSAVRNPLKPVTLKPFAEFDKNGNPAVAVYRAAPKKLSEWELLVIRDGKYTPAADLLDYDLNTPLFSDYTDKHRLIRLPRRHGGDSAAQPVMKWSDTEPLEFPVGTVIAKTFAYPDDTDDLTPGERFLETRIELRTDTGWYGYAYIWNEEQTDADLSLGGGEVSVTWKDASGMSHQNLYQIPNANQCLVCHSQNGRFQPLGPTVRNLNRDHPVHGRNQLQAWIEAGFLDDASDVKSADVLVAFDDTQAPLDLRARAWLEVNCAHCHSPAGSARTSGLDLRAAQSSPARFGVMKSPVAAGKGSGGRRYDIVPGKPDESILMYRIETDEPGARMPNLARNLVHAEGVELVRRWIQEMPAPSGSGTE